MLAPPLSPHRVPATRKATSPYTVPTAGRAWAFQRCRVLNTAYCVKQIDAEACKQQSETDRFSAHGTEITLTSRRLHERRGIRAVRVV